MTVSLFRRSLPLDGNGLPERWQHAQAAAAQELREWVNELPESVYHMGPSEADDATERVLRRFWHELTRGSR